MNKKQKSQDKREPPKWLVNLIIRLRVARWRLIERLNRWAAGRKRSHMIVYFAILITTGMALYFKILVFQPRHNTNMKALKSIYRQDTSIWDHRWKWVRLGDELWLRKDETFYWHLFDSLMADSNLRHSIDSLLKARPGLADTLHQLEEIHPRQTK